MYSMADITTLYVSQRDGDDEWQGFFPYPNDDNTGPLKTVEAALKLAADLRRAGGQQPLAIKIMDEIYYLEKPVVIGSGTCSVTLEPFFKTILSGGVRVEGFRRDRFNGVDCVSADLSGLGSLDFTDFYVNGRRAQFTRYPQEGTLRPEDVENHSSELHAHSRWFIARKEDLEVISRFRNFGDCFISFNHYWVDEHTPIREYDLGSGRITFRYASRYAIELTHARSALEYIIENVAEGFRNPGEWYYDKPAGRVYYIPREDEIAEEIEAFFPVAEKLIQVEGEPGNPARNILIRNFDIAYTRGDYRSPGDHSTPGEEALDGEGFEGYASDGQSMCSAYGSVVFTFASHCGLEDCRLYCLGVHAIVLEKGASHIRITGNHIREMGAGGIRVNGGAFGSDPATHTFGNLVSDNIITNCGMRYFSSCGILLMHSYDNAIVHNTISWLYYSGISCGWVWGYGDSISRDNLIEKNHIHHIGQGMLSDMGGIYLLGRQPGTAVRGNVIHDVEGRHYGGWGIYTDEGSSGILLEGNLCYDIGSNCFYQHYGQMNTVRNNIFAFSKGSPVRLFRRELHTGVILENNIIITEGQPAYRTDHVFLLTGHNNIFYDLSGKEPMVWQVGDIGYTLGQMQEKYGVESKSAWLAPGFADLQGRDFSLSKEDCAWTFGFRQTDFRDCGARL